MSAHGPMPKSAWTYPALAMALFAAVTAAGYEFVPSAGGWLFAAVLLAILLHSWERMVAYVLLLAGIGVQVMLLVAAIVAVAK